MYNPQIGNSLDTLDTPSMIVNLPLMEANIARLMQRFSASHVKIRPHLKTVKSPILARKLIEAGAIGGCVAKVSEAEVMAEGGIADLLITSEIVGRPKVQRLVALVQRHPQIKVVVDSLAGAQGLNERMEGTGQRLQVLIELNVGQQRCGVAPGEAALTLARQLQQLNNLQLVGVQGYEGHLQHVHGDKERKQQCLSSMQKLTETVHQLREAGFPIEIVTTGGTGTAEFCASCEVVTEIQPGSFIFMDTDYRNAIGTDYANALTVLSTVISRPAPERAIIDAGLKSLSIDSGMPEAKGLLGVRYVPGGDEHGILHLDNPCWLDGTPAELKVGERIEMIPSHIDTTVNLHDTYYAYRDGVIEAIWPVAARGKVQ